HQAKGLEFGAVFVLNLNENSFPLKRSIEADDLGEERRLFYVAVTRAKRELYLCVPSQVVVDQKKTRFPIPLQQSRFLNEVSHKTYEVLEITRPRVWSGRPGSNR
ncbi:MAG: ATP-binding domain-containing protein, partial [Opitutales bacterium]|nr:ATP-binding domain-containing protein [Opitutales bacterium]